MMDGKKPSLAVLIGMPKSHDDKGMSDDHSGDEDKAYADAGDSLMDALKKGDGQAVADAVCALVDLHMASKDDHGEPDEDDKKGEEYAS